jgi:exosome complex component RRP4
MRKIVYPGEFLTDQRKRLGANIYLESNKVYSLALGLLVESNDFISVIPLNGPYLANIGDGVIGVIKSENANGYIIDISSVYESYFPKSLLTKKLNIGDLIYARVKSTDDGLSLDNINILPKGNVMSISSKKVPRIIGKNESMLNILKKYTSSNIVIGKNGRIWYISKKEKLLEKAISIIIKNSQKSKLTDFVENYLKSKL